MDINDNSMAEDDDSDYNHDENDFGSYKWVVKATPLIARGEDAIVCNFPIIFYFYVVLYLLINLIS